MGKLTINIYKWPFSIAMLVITRGYFPAISMRWFFAQAPQAQTPGDAEDWAGPWECFSMTWGKRRKFFGMGRFYGKSHEDYHW